MVALAAAGLMVCSGVTNIAMAQTPDGNSRLGSPGNPCQVEPEDGANEGERDGGSGNGTADQNNGASRPWLEDCNGVLVPPATGDQEIVEPPPDTGTTPVIPPGAVPGQPDDPEPQ